jgi:hypothetical protein
VPASTSVAGWYTGSPRPGQVGSAIIASHIDSYRGPGVFFRLRLLRPGDRGYVRHANGTLAVFRVYAEHSYAKDRFPTQKVCGPAPDPELRLITCGGPKFLRSPRRQHWSAAGLDLVPRRQAASVASARQPFCNRHWRHERRAVPPICA